MGLFDFAKDLGKKLFGAGDDPAEKIKQSINAANPGVSPASRPAPASRSAKRCATSSRSPSMNTTTSPATGFGAGEAT